MEPFWEHCADVARGQGWRLVKGKGKTKQWAWRRSWVHPLFHQDVDACLEQAAAKD